MTSTRRDAELPVAAVALMATPGAARAADASWAKRTLPPDPAHVAAGVSGVRSGPLQTTSFAPHDWHRRHPERPPGMRTALPTHVMGRALDISILYTSISFTSAGARGTQPVMELCAVIVWLPPIVPVSGCALGPLVVAAASVSVGTWV